MQTDRGPVISRREARRIESSHSRRRRPVSFVVGFLVALLAFAGGGWAMTSLVSGGGLAALGGDDDSSDSVRIVSQDDEASRAAAPADRADAAPSVRTSTDASRGTPRTKPATTTTKKTVAPSVKTTTEPAKRKTTTKASPPADKTTTSSKPADTGTGGSGGAQTADEAEVLRLVNVERKKAGCKAVTANATLVKVARAHSKDMAVNNYFDHNSPDGRSPFDRMSKAGYTYSLAAENIAAGKASPADIMDMWMNSPGHKANILNCDLKELGVGEWTQPGSKYTYYWTQDFGTPR